MSSTPSPNRNACNPQQLSGTRWRFSVSHCTHITNEIWIIPAEIHLCPQLKYDLHGDHFERTHTYLKNSVNEIS